MAKMITFMPDTKEEQKGSEEKSFCVRFFDDSSELDFERAVDDFSKRYLLTLEQRDGAYIVRAPGPMDMSAWDGWRFLWGLARLYSTTTITEKGVRYYAAVLDFEYIAPCARPLAS